MFKRIGFTIALLLICSNAWAASLYFIGETDSHTNDVNNWATSSGGTTHPAAIPGASDTAYFDGNSPSALVDAAWSVGSIDCTGYTNTLTLGANLTVSGNLTFVAGMTFTPSTYTVDMNSTGTLTSGTKVFSNLSFSGAAKTVTVADDINISGTLTLSSASGANIFNGNNFLAAGDVTRSSAHYNNSGTTIIKITGNGNQTITLPYQATNFNKNPVTIDKSGGTATFSSGRHYLGGGLNYVGGTSDFTTNSTQITFGDNASFAASSGVTFYKLGPHANKALTITLNDDISVTNTCDLDNPAGVLTINTGKILCSGDVARSSSGYYNDGSGSIEITGNSPQTITIGGSTTNNFRTNLIINKSGDTATFSGTNYLGAGSTVTYTAGTVDAGTSTLSIAGSCTLNTNGIDWYNITHSATNTTTLSSALTSTNTHTFTGATTFSGAFAVNGKDILFNGAVTHTLSNDWSFTGNITTSAHTSLAGAYDINLEGDLLWTGTYNLGYTGGTAVTIVMNKATDNQTIGSTGTDCYLNLSVTVDKASGNIVFANTNINYGWNKDGGVLTLTSADAVTYGTSVWLFKGSSTITGAWDFYSLSPIGNTKTLTISNDIDIFGDLIGGVAMSISGAFDIHVKGNVNWSATGNLGYTTSDPTIIIDGTGNQTLGNASYTCYLNLSTTVNKASGNFTFANCTIYFGWNTAGRTFTYTTADSFVAGTSSFRSANNCNLNFGTAVLYDLQISQAGTATLTGNATVSHTCTIDASRTLNIQANTLTLQGDCVNNGTLTAASGTVALTGSTAKQSFTGNNITFGTFQCIAPTVNKEICFLSGKTYTFNTALTLISSYGGNSLTLSASTPDTVTNFDIDAACTQTIERVIVVDNDASAGETGHDYKGTITDAQNVNWDDVAPSTPTPTAYAWIG